MVTSSILKLCHAKGGVVSSNKCDDVMLEEGGVGILLDNTPPYL